MYSTKFNLFNSCCLACGLYSAMFWCYYFVFNLKDILINIFLSMFLSHPLKPIVNHRRFSKHPSQHKTSSNGGNGKTLGVFNICIFHTSTCILYKAPCP